MDLHNMAMDIRKMSRKELGYISLAQEKKGLKSSFIPRNKSRQSTGTELGSLRRRRRLMSHALEGDQDIEPQPQQEQPRRITSNAWQQEEMGMTNEVRKFFAEQQRYGRNDQTLQQNLNQTLTHRDTLLRRRDGIQHRQIEEQQTQLPNVTCTDPDASLRCPPENLPLLCDKYGGGNFESCYQKCKPSYCCAHDSQSQTVSPSCAQTEVNCRHYIPCFIVWWRLADAIGPPVYITALQDDDFFDVDVFYLQKDLDEDPTFREQLFQHHTDDDTVQDGDFFKNPDNWL